MILGCIGDDFTGSSDLGNTLRKKGMHVVQYNGIPEHAAESDVDAGIIALKSRSCSASVAKRDALLALDWLKRQGCRQFFFKYCSTFDSTREGNIGPVAESLLEALGETTTVFCPAFPATGRSVYQGHLFVNNTLLNESGMESHPLTPMVDSDIRRWLSYQVESEVGHIPFTTVSQGANAITRRIDELTRKNQNLIVIDAILDTDLYAIGQAVCDLRLITGGSGVAQGLPENYRIKGWISACETKWTPNPAPAVVLSGSCSSATRRQVQHHLGTRPAMEIDVDALIHNALDTAHLVNWCIEHQHDLPMIYSSAEPDRVERLQSKYGAENIAERIETLFAECAPDLVASGFGRIVVAGGETSGAVVQALKCSQLEIGPEIDPGVPAVRDPQSGVALALKSGNFGAIDFFEKAAHVLSTPS
ncbi:MAG: 3-oxo-tetronate kinase [Pseudomonadota bacterium]